MATSPKKYKDNFYFGIFPANTPYNRSDTPTSGDAVKKPRGAKTYYMREGNNKKVYVGSKHTSPQKATPGIVQSISNFLRGK